MVDPETLMISCEGPGRIVGAMNALMPQLPPDIRKRLNEIKLSYWQRYGEAGLYERVHSRTVSRILSEYDGDDLTPIESGERDGLRWALYEAPEANKDIDENKK